MVNRNLALCLLACLLGCIEGRESTHELDHVVPAHWPADLADAADKIESTLSDSISGTAALSHEKLIEIVSWIPEVAANTSMSEATWMPLYSTCGQIEDKLRTSGDHQAVHTELKGLCVSLRQLHEQVTPREEPLADGR